MPDTAETEKPKRLQCRHIFNDGRRCGAVCLRNQEFCYYHHTTRRPAASRNSQSTFELPLPEDRSAIQTSIGLVLQRIASNDLDPRRAGLLLYGLQIASLNLPKEKHDPDRIPPPPVEEIVIHPQLGTIAPEGELPPPYRSSREQLCYWREKEVMERESKLYKREKELNEREANLRKQEQQSTQPIAAYPTVIPQSKPSPSRLHI